MEKSFDIEQPLKRKRKKHRFLKFILILPILNLILLGTAYYFAGRMFGYEEVNKSLFLAKDALIFIMPTIKERILDQISYLANFL